MPETIVPNTSTNSDVPPVFKPEPIQPTVSNKTFHFQQFKKLPPKLLIYLGVVFLIVLFAVFIYKFIGHKPQIGSVNLTWWGLWEDPEVVDSLIKEYESSHPNIKINYIKQSPADYRERLTNSLAKGNGPDIFRFHNTWVPMLRNDLDNLPSSVINPADFAKTFYPIASSDLTVGKGIVGIPVEYDALMLYVNTDIFNKAGKNPPTTWDELRSVARDLTIKDSQGVITQSGVALGRTENVDHWPEIIALMMLENGVDLTNPVGKQAEDALKFFSIFSTVDGVWDQTLPPSTQAFAAGKLAMYLAPSWRVFEIFQANPNLKFKTYPVPQLPKDNPQQKDVTYATYWVEGVWARSAHKEAAWDFLKFLSSQSSLQKFYQNASKTRLFGEPYPRTDMASILLDHPILSSLISQAPGAQSWFLASRTFDGPTGINSLLAKYFEDAINSTISGHDLEQTLNTLNQGIKQILSQYGLIVR